MKNKEKYIVLTSQSLGITQERFLDITNLPKEVFEIFHISQNFIYYISNMGRIKRQSNGQDKVSKSRIKISICVGRLDRTNYPKFVNARKKYAQNIHRIVAKQFIPNPENKYCVNHKNGDKYDNRVENLEWMTSSENNIHAIESGLRGYRQGIKHHTACPVAQYNKDGSKLLGVFCSYKEASEKTGICGIWIGQLVRRSEKFQYQRNISYGHKYKWEKLTKEEYQEFKEILSLL